MNLSVRFSPAAQAEFIDASAWYEDKRQALGLGFIEDVEHAIAQAANNPQRFAVVRSDIRRVVVKRFPYCVYFRVEVDMLIVLAVFHTSRAPARWRDRI